VLYEVRTSLRKGVLDQQGQAVAKALVDLGWSDVQSCRIGKIYLIEYTGDKDIREIVKHIYNDVMEDFEVIQIND
jgi:phosphoribosylformylglycinamidine (FGAM) synthase PurS component